MDEKAKRARLVNATASLTQWLAPLSFENLAAREVTELVTEEVAAWVAHCGFRVAHEYRVEGTWNPRLASERQGRIDVFGVHPSGVRVAIEIDRASKQWSVEKLHHEANQGVVALWVKWGGPSRIIVPDNVGLVEVRARYRSTTEGHRISRPAA
ncbi:hypothetical protein AB0F95_06840 [Micromonospora tulbaghiae]|uniref:hypothetical protein n=1 Tax=Micromonospora TaxID=1873 RepID=UPI00124AEAA3|nr:hypothetical protein [Micromonospora sp. AMSO1212t]KAB1906985.1 hypothetical protein F8279_12340 [Micromonospora sp. AMSO1212t]